MTTNEYDSFSDSDDDDEYDIIYEYGETGFSKYNIVLCELYNENVHGIPECYSNVMYHYLTINRYKKLHMDLINDIAEFLNIEYIYLPNKNHHIFKNYKNIITQVNYIKPEIAECIYLPNGECVSVIKTFWIRLIQRTWKRVFKERQNILKKRYSLKALHYKELHGRWPEYCIPYSSIKGMLVS
jgi:hypothetical protein